MKQTTKKPAAPAIERPHKNLTKIQEELADIASDILLNGGAREDVELLLTALLRHDHRSFAGDEGSEKANEFAKRHLERDYLDLARVWPKKGSQEEEEDHSPQPERPVTRMVRENIRVRFLDQIEDFLRRGRGIEPIWLLNEILEDINAGDEPTEAIWRHLDRADIYVRVPSEHKKRIEEFVAFLEKGRAA